MQPKSTTKITQRKKRHETQKEKKEKKYNEEHKSNCKPKGKKSLLKKQRRLTQRTTVNDGREATETNRTGPQRNGKCVHTNTRPQGGTGDETNAP